MKLSVLVTAYNADKTLKPCLDSLLNQGIDDYEIIVVNDGSSDHTAEIMNEYEVKYPKIFKMIHQENGGVSVARNSALNAALGEYVTYVDSDDFVYELSYAHILKIASQHNSDLVVYDANYITLEGVESPFRMLNLESGLISSQQYYLAPPCPWNKIMRRRLFIENKLSFNEGMIYEDYALIPNLAQTAKSIYYLAEPLIGYVLSDNSIMRSASYKAKSVDIIKASQVLLEHCDMKQFSLEVEYVIYEHLLVNSARYFLAYEQYEVIHQIADFMKKNFPNWKKNPYIRLTPFKDRFISGLFIHKKAKLVQCLVSSKRKIRSV